MSAMKRILELMVGSTGSGKSTTNERRPAVEVMLNTQNVAEMVATPVEPVYEPASFDEISIHTI
jgi:Tfp pilus assembly ATPase PilU